LCDNINSFIINTVDTFTIVTEYITVSQSKLNAICIDVRLQIKYRCERSQYQRRRYIQSFISKNILYLLVCYKYILLLLYVYIRIVLVVEAASLLHNVTATSSTTITTTTTTTRDEICPVRSIYLHHEFHYIIIVNIDTVSMVCYDNNQPG